MADDANHYLSKADMVWTISLLHQVLPMPSIVDCAFSDLTSLLSGGKPHPSIPMLHKFANEAEASKRSASKKHRLRLRGATVTIDQTSTADGRSAVAICHVTLLFT